MNDAYNNYTLLVEVNGESLRGEGPYDSDRGITNHAVNSYSIREQMSQHAALGHSCLVSVCVVDVPLTDCPSHELCWK